MITRDQFKSLDFAKYQLVSAGPYSALIHSIKTVHDWLIYEQAVGKHVSYHLCHRHHSCDEYHSQTHCPSIPGVLEYIERHETYQLRQNAIR